MARTIAHQQRSAARHHSVATVFREVALWTGAALGVLSITIAAAAVVLGVKPLIFMSGSMNPTIPTGSLALVIKTPIDKIKLHDIVSYETTLGLRITHRVVKVQVSGGDKVLTLKGDANKTADVEPVTQPYVDREFWSVPYLGYAMNELLKPQWSFAGGAIVGILVAIGFRRRRDVHVAHVAEREHDAEVAHDVDLAEIEATERASEAHLAELSTAGHVAVDRMVPSATAIVNAGYERRFALAQARREAEHATFNGIALFNGLDTVAEPDRAN